MDIEMIYHIDLLDFTLWWCGICGVFGCLLLAAHTATIIYTKIKRRFHGDIRRN